MEQITKVDMIEFSHDSEWVFELANLADEPGGLNSPLLSLLREVLEEISREGVMKKSAPLEQLTDIPRERLRIEYEIIENQLREYVDLDPRLSGIDLLQYMCPCLLVYERIPVSGSVTPQGNEILEIYKPLTATDIVIRFIEFLNATAPERIKKCQQCKRLYLAKQRRSAQKYCSEICKRAAKWPPEKWAEYMRSRRKDKKLEMSEKAKQVLEEEIQRRMDICGCTRKEIVEQMKADKNA
jgi:hypothetical protein